MTNSPENLLLKKQFIKKGYIQFNSSSTQFFNELEDVVCNFFNCSPEELTNIHNQFNVNELNDQRIKLFRKINNTKNWEEKYYKIFIKPLNELVGNEISIQNKLNLSIQFPHDSLSQVPMHTDRAGGQSLYEVVAWLSLTDAKKTASMYITSPETTKSILKDLPKYEDKGLQLLEKKYLKEFKFLNVKKGDAVIFSSNLYHGNVVNKERKTRISVNCRFKNLWSPEFKKYPNERVTGSFYKPLSISPVSSFGLSFFDCNPDFSK